MFLGVLSHATTAPEPVTLALRRVARRALVEGINELEVRSATAGVPLGAVSWSRVWLHGNENMLIGWQGYGGQIFSLPVRRSR